MAFKNQHLSYSRLSRFEQCPLSFKLHYIDKRQDEPGVPLRFGKAVHAVLETLLREHMEQEREGALSEERAVALWQEAWAAGELSGLAVFEEGLAILRSFVRRQGHVDHQDVLAIEKRFELEVGPFTVLGFIDRVDRVDDETVEVIDYKTNRLLFSREEVDSSLQMSLYHLAARQLWPWAKRVRLTFDMLRHDLRMTTERDEEQLAAAVAYVETMGRMTEEAREFPARLNANCVYCDHRQDCPAYAAALQGQRSVICEDTGDLELVAREREEVARLSKILYARKQELEDVLKAHLDAHDELVLAGVRYRMFNAASKSYPLDRTLEVLARATGDEREQLVGRLASIDNKAVDGLLKDLAKTLGKDRVNLLKAELEAVVEKRFSQRFWAKEVA